MYVYYTAVIVWNVFVVSEIGSRRCGLEDTSALCTVCMHCALFRMVGQLRFMLVWLVAVALLASAVSAAVEKTATSAEDLDRNRERSQRVRYTSSWAVEITEGGDKAADVVARRHGYRNLGKVDIILY